MPGGNPVSAAPTVTQTKSFRSRLGLGFGSGGSVSSSKPSFFSLRPGRKSIGGPGDLKNHEHPILLIDPEVSSKNGLQESRVVLNDEPDLKQSPSRNLSFQLPRSLVSHSVPSSPTRNGHHYPVNVAAVSSSTNGAASTLNPDESTISKNLPDLPANLSLLMNELPPDTVSQSDFHDSKTSHSEKDDPEWMGKEDVFGIALPTQALDDGHTPRFLAQSNVSSVHQAQTAVSSSLVEPQGGDRVVQNGGAENASVSFDLSSARLSLDLMRKSLGHELARSLPLEASAPSSAESSAILNPSISLIVENENGPVTSTPFLSRRGFAAGRQEAGDEASFNLDALDPDLVALLRPNTFSNHPTPENVVFSPSDPFIPPEDPLNPDTTARPTSVPPTSPATSSSHRINDQMDKVLTPRKYATRSASTSSVHPVQSQISNVVLEGAARATTPSIAADRPDLSPTLRDYSNSNRPSSQRKIVPPVEAGASSGVSKLPNTILSTLSERGSDHDSNAMHNGLASVSTTPFENVTTRRKVRTGTHLLSRANSALSSSSDARPSPPYFLQDRDGAQSSTSPSLSPTRVSPFASGSLGRERDRTRTPLEGIFPARLSPERKLGRRDPANVGRSLNEHRAGSLSKQRERGTSLDRVYRKRSMSLDQDPAVRNYQGADPLGPGFASSRFRPLADGNQDVEWNDSEASEARYGANALDVPSEGRHRERYAYGFGDRERHARSPTDWLGPRTAKAFAAAGLIHDQRDHPGSKYASVSRSTSERDFRSVLGNGRERERWSPISGLISGDGERERGHLRHQFTSSVRSGGDRDTPSGTRPPSRNEYNRPPALFARTISDLMSHRGSGDGRESANGMHHRTGSAYSPGGGTGPGSVGSGGGRASPTTTSSLVAAQSQMNALKEKHDAQTEALLAALADSQKTSRELREENETLRAQLRLLEERFAETIANLRQKEKEIARMMNARPQSPDRIHVLRSPPQTDRAHVPTTQLPRTLVRSLHGKRRLSTSSSVFPTVPTSMSLLMAETPGTPPQGSPSSSRPPSPTLVLPKQTYEQNASTPRDASKAPQAAPPQISVSHKRSTSGASVATSANFSFETGSPGSLKLKPEHELLLNDITRLSLVTGSGGESEQER